MQSDLIDGKDDFIIYTPGVVDILKAGEGEDLEELRPIGGYCSTERLDRQDEVVLAKGLDFSEFVNYGYYNDNHKQDTAAILGVPKLAKLTKSRWYTEGNLLKGYEPADRVWALAKALKKSNLGRKLGFSIEGKVKERGMDNRIVRAKIRHVAITNSPVNVSCTWDILTKSFGSPEEVEAACIRKTLSVSYQGPNHAGGAALVPESLERKPRKLTFDETVKFIKKARPVYAWATCEQLARVIYKLEERRN